MVFLPVIAAKQFNLIFHDPEYSLWLTFLSFSMVSAAGYIFNDLSNFDTDRADPKRRKYKPIANGTINKQSASFWLAVFLLGGLMIAQKNLNNQVVLWEASYFALSMAYSLFLKKIPVLGLALVSLGAAFRVLAGAAALEMAALPILLGLAAIINLAINFTIQAHSHRR